MSNIQYNLTTDNSQFLQGMSQADNAQKALAKGIVEIEKDSKKAFDEAGKGAKGYGDETKKTEDKTKSLKAQLRELKAQLADATDPEEIIKLSRKAGELADRIGDANEAAAIFATESPFEAVGNSIGGVIGKLRNLDFKGAADQSKLLVSASKSITFKEGIQGVKDLGTTLVNMGKSLLMNPIFLLGTALTLIITNFDTLKNSGGLIGDIFGGIGDAIGFVIDKGKEFLQVIGLIGEARMTLEDFEKINSSIVTSIGNKYDYEIAKAKAAGKEVVKLEIEKQKEILKQLDKAQERLVSDQRKNLIDIEKYNEKIIENSRAKQAAEIAILNAEAEARKAAIEKRKKAQEDLAQALLDLLKKSNAAELSMLTGKEKLDFQKKLSEQEVAELEEALKKKLIAAGKGNKLSAEQEKEFGNLRAAINREYYNGLLQLAIQEAQTEANVSKAKNDTLISDFELRNTIVKNGINSVLAAEGATNLEREILEQERQTLLLDNEKKYQQEKLALTLKGIDAENNVKKAGLQAELNIVSQKEDAVSVARAKALESEIDSINTSGELAKQAAIGSTQNAINGVEEEIRKNDINKKLTGYKIDWARLFGVSDTELNGIKQNLSKLANEAGKIVQMYLDFQEKQLSKELENNDKKKQLLDKDISELESKLKSENDLKNDGLANDSQRLSDELAEKKKQKKEALEEEKRIKKEQEKLAKEQLLLDQATQASSLVTAIAQIFASTAGAGPIGVALAAVTIAAMLASFAYAQGQASQAINKTDNSFAEGVVGLKGPGTETSDSIPANLSLNESVITAKGTRKAPTLLKGLNANDNFLIEKGIAELLENTGVSLSGLPEELRGKKSIINKAEYAMRFNSNNSGVEKRLDVLSNKFDALNSGLNDSVTYLENGTKIIRKGVNETIIRKRNK